MGSYYYGAFTRAKAAGHDRGSYLFFPFHPFLKNNKGGLTSWPAGVQAHLEEPE